MRTCFLLVAFLMSGAPMVAPATAAMSKDERDCVQAQDSNLKISACTRVMEDQRRSRTSQSMAADNRCLAYIHIGDYAHAAADCMESTRLNPRNSAAWNNLGNARMSSGDFDGAIAAYDMALRIGPMDPLTIANLAVSWGGKRRQRSSYCPL